MGLGRLTHQLARWKRLASESANESFDSSRWTWEPDCAECRDTGGVVIEGKGTRVCQCVFVKRRAARKNELLAEIPPEYRGHSLRTLEPRDECQRKLISYMRENPKSSLLICGDNDSGKTLMGWLAYREAVEQGRPAVVFETPKLLKKLHQYSIQQIDTAPVDPDQFCSDQEKYCVVLDDFGFCTVTQGASVQMWMLLNAIYIWRHQLIVTTTMLPDQLYEHWSKIDTQYGLAIIRRVVELDGIKLMEMYKNGNTN